MKVSFYAIYTYDKETKKRGALNLNLELLKHVISLSNNALEVEDYFLFAHHINRECFLITKTYDSDFVKRINTKTYSVDEIKNALTSDEAIAFPSFLLIKENIIGYANTQHGPRVRDLETYISNKIDIPKGYKLVIEPLMRDVTKAQALEMQFIGRTTLRVEAGSRMLPAVLKAMGVTTVEEELLDAVEIIIKPKRSRNISDMSKEIIRNSEENFSDILIKGRELAADMLTEFYLSDKGHISNNINKSSNEDIAEEMESCFIKMKHVILKSYNEQTDGDF